MLRSFAMSALQSKTGNIELTASYVSHYCTKRHCIYGADFLISEDGTYRAFLSSISLLMIFAIEPVVVLDIYETYV